MAGRIRARRAAAAYAPPAPRSTSDGPWRLRLLQGP